MFFAPIQTTILPLVTLKVLFAVGCPGLTFLGMSFIVAVLLMHMNEETSFWVFVQMMKRYNMAPFFIDHVYPAPLAEFSEAFERTLPEVDAHLVRNSKIDLTSHLS